MTFQNKTEGLPYFLPCCSNQWKKKKQKKKQKTKQDDILFQV